MQKSTHSPHYAMFLKRLIALRKKAGLNQRELARLLGKEHSFVARMEIGDRRLDIVEFFWICQALSVDPSREFRKLAEQWLRSFPVVKRLKRGRGQRKAPARGKRKRRTSAR